MKKIIIVASSKNGVIGKDGKIPWHSSEDFKHFKKTTMGYPIIMGRKTFESIGKPLPGRLNIILSQSFSFTMDLDNVIICNSVDEAYSVCELHKYDKVFIIGGGKIYSETFDNVDEIIISKMNFETEGDIYFPEIKEDNWKLTSKDEHKEFVVHYYLRK